MRLPTGDDRAGVGAIISSAVVAAIGNGAGFTQGRDFAAWLGLVPIDREAVRQVIARPAVEPHLGTEIRHA